MDYPVRSGNPTHAMAMVVWANRFQFAPGEVIVHRDLKSRMMLWGNAGVGSIEVAGQTVDLTPSTFVAVPWRDDITYRADPHDPFMVSGIHLVPWHAPAVPVELQWADNEHDRLTGVPDRRDVDWPELRDLVERTVRPGDRLLAAANLTVDHVSSGRPDGVSLRALAALLLNELWTSLAQPQVDDADVPPVLTRMQEYIASHLRKPLSVREVAAAAAVSESTAERVFRRHAGMSVGRWVVAKRMAMAREQLRTTNASVAQVARAVGFEDPSYFSRVFHRTHGVPPSTYAARSRVI